MTLQILAHARDGFNGRVAYAFAAAVTTIPVPAQLVHRILLPDDRSFIFPVPWHFLQLCEDVIGFSWTVHYPKWSSRHHDAPDHAAGQPSMFTI
jgi:hypothetical protein